MKSIEQNKRHLSQVELTDSRAKLFWDAVRATPYRFDLFHVLRYLQARNASLPRLGKAARPRFEPLRLGQDPSLAFAPATLAEVLPSLAGEPERLTVWSFGLYGPNGPMPTHLTEYVRERLRQHDDATLARFSDIFHHRMLLLFFRAWADAQPAVSLDRPEDDPFGRYVGSLIGIGLQTQQERDVLPDHAKRHLAGHFTRSTRNPEGLCQALSHFFSVPVRLHEHCIHYLELLPEQQTRLGKRTHQSRLGLDTVVGARVPDAQYKFSLDVGPLTLLRYNTLLPGGKGFSELVAWVRNYVGIEYAWDFRLVLSRTEVPRASLGGEGRLGWTTWIGNQPAVADARDFCLDAESWLRTRNYPVRSYINPA